MLFGKKKKLESLRKQWGKQVDRYRNIDMISAYHDIVSTKEKGEYVDDKTWNDLNFESIFTKMDRNISSIGQQYLYHKLRAYEKDNKKLSYGFELIEKFKNDQELRETVQLQLFGLQGMSAYFIPNVILTDSLPFLKYYFVFYILALLPLVFGFLMLFNGIFLFVMLGFLFVNLILNKIYTNRIYSYFKGFEGVNDLLITAKKLSKIGNDYNLKELNSLTAKKSLIKRLNKKIGWLVLDKESMSEMIAIIIEYMNFLFLLDIIAYYRSVNMLRKYRSNISEIYETIAKLDASISIASYLHEIPYYCRPMINEQKKLGFKEMYHPLIPDAVSNSINDLQKSVLITGSNMSGKTTFIKTVGINVILSRTLFFSLAREFNEPGFIVKAAVKREEDLENRKSYFFVEVEELYDFIKLSDGGQRYIFLIDEIFRGTNTVERLSASTAVLKYLNHNNFVFVTTHDIELQELLQNDFEMLHFSEQVEGNEYFFDYKIHRGPCTTRNAIKLLEIKNYPEAIIKEAISVASKLS